jgi:hypothetical protein
MNPPTTGHQLLVDKLVAYARDIGAAPRVYLSHSVGKKDPLQYDKKVAFARAAFGSLVKKSNARTVIEVLKQLEKEGFTHVTMFAGSDRVPEFTTLITKYNGREYNFDEIEVKSAGERDPDADDVSGMSASKMRALAKDDNVAEFLRGAPHTLRAAQAKNMFTAVRKALLGEDVMEYNHDDKFVSFIMESSDDVEINIPSDSEISKHIDDMDLDDFDLDDADALMLDVILGQDVDKEEVNEARALSIQTRQKLSQRMKAMSKRLAKLRELKRKQVPASSRLRMRARKAALMILRARATGKKQLDYSSLSRSQRVAVDNALINRFGKGLNRAVDTISKRILPMIRKKAQTSVAQARDIKEQTIDPKTKKLVPDQKQDNPLNLNALKINVLDTDPLKNDRVAPDPDNAHKFKNRHATHFKAVDEGRKSASDKDARDAGDTNIIYQMRKTVNSRGEHETTFANGQTSQISVADAKKMLAKFEALRMPADKHEFTIEAGKSLASFRDVLAHGVQKKTKKISLGGGKPFKEFYMGVGRTRTISPYDGDEPPGTRRIAEAKSAGGVEPDENDDPNKPRKTNTKLDLLLRLGLADTDELQKYRRALRSSKKQALQSPEMRKKLADLLDKLIDIVTGDPSTYSRVRYKVQTQEAIALLKKAEKSGVDVNVLAEVFMREIVESDDTNRAFNRVNSFIAGGKAADMDKDLTEGEVLKTKLAQKLLQKKGIVPPHEPDMDDMMRNWFNQKKIPDQAYDADRIAYHGNKARFYNDKKKTHYDIKGGAPKIADVKGGKLTSTGNYAPPVSYKQDKVKKRVGNVIKFSDLKKKKTNEAVKEPTGGLKSACWKGYTAVGMKMKNGRQVPNCVPKEETQVSEVSAKFLRRAADAADRDREDMRDYRLSHGDRKVTPDEEKRRKQALKFRVGAVMKKEEVEEQNMSTHDAVPLNKRVKRVKSFHAWAPKSVNEVQRTADVKMVKARLPDGRMVYRKDRTPTKVQDEAYTGSEPASNNTADPANRFVGTNSIRQNYANVTPGQGSAAGEIAMAKFAPEKVDYTSSMARKTRTEVDQSKDDLSKKHFNDIRKALGGIRESRELNESFAAGFELAPFARDYGITVQSAFEHHPDVQSQIDAMEATYKGKTVPLNKPMAGDVKKSKVYVDPDGDGKAKKVNFGDKKLSIKKDQPARKRSYCARSSGQGNLKNKSSANYWSRRAWDC